MKLNLEQQRKRAKELRAAHARRDAAAIERVAPYFPNLGRLALAQAQLVVAREAGFASWPALVRAVTERDDREEAALDHALAGRAAELRALLADDPELTRRSPHVAAAAGDVDALAPGHRRGGRRAWTPLMYACATRIGDRVRVVRRLVELGADLDAVGADGDREVRAIELAARAGSAELVRALAEAGATVARTTELVSDAVRSGSVATLEATLAIDPPWWQRIWALQAAAKIDAPGSEIDALARMLAARATMPSMLQPGLVAAIRHGRSRALIEAMLAGPAELVAALRPELCREATRCAHDAALELLGPCDVPDVDRAIGACMRGERVDAVVTLTADDQRMLCWAIATGRDAAVPHLLALGLDPDAADRDGNRPLHLAVRAGSLAVVEALLAAGADPDARDFDERTPLDRATGAIAERLVAAGGHTGARRDLAQLFERAADAVAFGELDELRALLDREPALVHARSPRNHRATLLHYCAANGTESPRQRTPPNAPAIAQLLVDRGADVDAECRMYGGGDTTMHLLLTSAIPHAAGLDAELARILARAGANLDGALRGAIAYNFAAAARALAEEGAPVDDVYCAAGLGRLERLTELLDAGADPDARFGDGATALHAAAATNQVGTARLLLARGADPQLRDRRWYNTPLDTARHFGHADMVALLTASLGLDLPPG